MKSQDYPLSPNALLLYDHLEEHRVLYNEVLSNLRKHISGKIYKELIEDVVSQVSTDSHVKGITTTDGNPTMVLPLLPEIIQRNIAVVSNTIMPGSKIIPESNNIYIKNLEQINEELNFILPLKDLIIRMNSDLEKFLDGEIKDNTSLTNLFFKINNTLIENKGMLKYMCPENQDHYITKFLVKIIGEDVFILQNYMNKLIVIEESLENVVNPTKKKIDIINYVFNEKELHIESEKLDTESYLENNAIYVYAEDPITNERTHVKEPIALIERNFFIDLYKSLSNKIGKDWLFNYCKEEYWRGKNYHEIFKGFIKFINAEDDSNDIKKMFLIKLNDISYSKIKEIFMELSGINFTEMSYSELVDFKFTREHLSIFNTQIDDNADEDITTSNKVIGHYLKYQFPLAKIVETQKKQVLEQTRDSISKLNLAFAEFVEKQNFIDTENMSTKLYKMNEELTSNKFDDYLSKYKHNPFTEEIIKILSNDLFEMQDLIHKLSSIPSYSSKDFVFRSSVYLLTCGITSLVNKIMASSSEDYPVSYSELVNKFLLSNDETTKKEGITDENLNIIETDNQNNQQATNILVIKGDSMEVDNWDL